MSKEAFVVGIAGVFFGVLVGWIVGTQQGGGRVAPAAAPAAQASSAQQGGAQAPPPLDESRAQRVARRIRAGQIDVNGGAFNMNAPFGGFKQSGNGREWGEAGLEEFLELKAIFGYDAAS